MGHPKPAEIQKQNSCATRFVKEEIDELDHLRSKPARDAARKNAGGAPAETSKAKAERVLLGFFLFLGAGLVDFCFGEVSFD